MSRAEYLASDPNRARAVGDRAARMLRRLLDENKRLSRAVHELRNAPLPDESDPGYQVWRALMEDMREDGSIVLTMKHVTLMEITYGPANSVAEEVSRDNQPT